MLMRRGFVGSAQLQSLIKGGGAHQNAGKLPRKNFNYAGSRGCDNFNASLPRRDLHPFE